MLIILSLLSDAAKEEKLKIFKDDGLKVISVDDFKRLLVKVRRFNYYGNCCDTWAK